MRLAIIASDVPVAQEALKACKDAHDWVRPDEIEPIYLRAPDAKINWATRAARS